MKKALFIIIVLAGLGVGYYFLFYKLDKKKAILILVKDDSSRDATMLGSFDENFVISWATAIRRGSPDFSYNGKNYTTSTGKAK